MQRTLILLVFAALPLAAQQRRMGHDDDKSHMAQMEEMMAPMMRAMAYTPAHLLARKDSLNLTAQQITRLTALQDAAQRAHDAARNTATAHMNTMAQVFAAANPDTAALRQHFAAAHTDMGSGHWAMLTAAAQARTVLTDEQRSRVERWSSGMKEHEPGHH